MGTMGLHDIETGKTPQVLPLVHRGQRAVKWGDMRIPLKHAAAGDRPALTQRRWLAVVAGLLALCLQLSAQVMPAEAMQGAMRAAALTTAEAQSFAATCLGLGLPAKGEPAKSGQHGASCPVCFSLAQGHGLATPTIDLVAAEAWTRAGLNPALTTAPAGQAVQRAFNSQAPPAVAV